MKKFTIMLAACYMLFSGIASATDVKFLYVGFPQGGPSMTHVEAYAANLNVGNSYVTVKDCKAALRVIDENPDVAYMLTTGIRTGETCSPPYKPKDIMYSTTSSWDVCSLPGKAPITTVGDRRFTFGMLSILPGKGFARDFNARNNAKMISIGYPTSSHVVAGLVNHDLEYGLVARGLAKPLVEAGKIQCTHGLIDGDLPMLGDSFDMLWPNLQIKWIGVAKASSPEVRAEMFKAARSTGFYKWLTSRKYVNIKTDGFTQADIDEFNAFNDNLMVLYKKGNK